MSRRVFILLLSLLITACQAKPHDNRDWYHATKNTIKRYQTRTFKHLAPAFKRAGVSIPPSELSLLVFKQEQKMEVWARNNKHRNWRYITEYALTARSGGPGPKLHEFDRQIPEGIYHISLLDPFSHYHLSMMLNYPNQFDKRHARHDHRRHLGKDIFIHGDRKSVGCLAIGDKAIEELFSLVGTVGKNNTQVIISPNDLRHAPPLKPINHPSWVAELNQQLSISLRQYRRK